MSQEECARLVAHEHTLPRATYNTLPHKLLYNSLAYIFGMSTHITTCYTCYIATYVTLPQSFLQRMHTYNFGIVHICTYPTRLTSEYIYIFFSLLSFLRKMDVTGPHFALEQVKWSTRWSMPLQSTCKGLHSTPLPRGLRRIIAVEKYFNAVSLYI